MFQVSNFKIQDFLHNLQNGNALPLQGIYWGKKRKSLPLFKNHEFAEMKNIE